MTTERFGIVKFRGQAVTVLGSDLNLGDVAPELSVQTLDWSPYNGLANTPGKVRIIAAVPCRAAFVVDRGGKITYAAYMPALGEEPNYAEVLAAAQAAL